MHGILLRAYPYPAGTPSRRAEPYDLRLTELYRQRPILHDSVLYRHFLMP
jgi:hypothetical protein